MALGTGDYVDGHATGSTELRVHGVAGTAPETVLLHPTVARVAGDAQAGFFRRVWQARSISADTAWSRTEAYSWGGLTSGDTTRALWLLLLPFMLLNVAFFMAPHRRAPDDGDTGAGLDRFSAAVQRLLALSFTATFALTSVSVAMDLVGWQCAAQHRGPDVCGTAWLRWLAWSGLDRPGRQLAVTALVPLAVIGLLWWLARATWQNLESAEVAQLRPGVAPQVRTPLEDRAMWNGRAAVRRLRALHVGTGLVVPGIFALAPLPAAPRVVLLAVQLAALTLVVVLVALPATGRRERPEAELPGSVQRRAERRRAERRDLYAVLPWATLALTAAALVGAVLAPAGPRPAGTLPWLVGAILGLFVAQSALLVLLLLACLGLRGRARRAAPPVCAPGARPVEVAPAWRGLAMPGVALLAWILAGGFSGGVILRTAQTLGTPVARGQASADPHPLVVPTAYYWAAVAALVLGAVAVVAGLVTWMRVRRSWPDRRAVVDEAYGPITREDPERRDEIAKVWNTAGRLSRAAQGAAGFLLVAAVAVVVVGAAGFVTVGTGLLTGAPALVDLADLALSGFVLVLLGVGRRAYRSETTRRTVGILWDLGTFWPRAVHPLAPPCYAERAIPDLMVRLRHDAAHGRAVLACHSQGSVLGAVVLLQVETAVSARTSFLTYGSPLARLYGGFFPAYVSAAALDRLGGFLSDGRAGRSSWRWRNLYRPSDPIGGAVLCERDLVAGTALDDDPGDVDRPVLDPLFARAPGDPSHPPVLGHAQYVADPAVVWTAAALRSGLLPRTADRPAGTSRPGEAPAGAPGG